MGDERVGKTSLINRLTGKAFNPNQQTTLGIDIVNLSLPSGVKLNIWDFAGQEITHQTHQLFFSHNSLYVYVLDAQQEDNDASISHWLNVLKSHAGDSPILIIISKMDLNPGYQFALNRYKTTANIVDVLYLTVMDEAELNPTIFNNIAHTVNDLTSTIENKPFTDGFTGINKGIFWVDFNRLF